MKIPEHIKELLDKRCEYAKEAEEYKNENEFMRGTAFAYRCVLNLFKDFGLDKE